MKIIKKNVYYCDFCKKKGLGKYYIEKHENRCTLNPNRVCGLCGLSNISDFVDKLKLHFEVKPDNENYGLDTIFWIGEKLTLSDLRTWVEDCPNCLLSLIRQSGLLSYAYNEFHFDYKTEVAVVFANKCNEDSPRISFQP